MLFRLGGLIMQCVFADGYPDKLTCIAHVCAVEFILESIAESMGTLLPWPIYPGNPLSRNDLFWMLPAEPDHAFPIANSTLHLLLLHSSFDLGLSKFNVCLSYLMSV